MKGFIEVNGLANTITIAVSAIAGVWDRGQDGTIISLNAPVAGLKNTEATGTILHSPDAYSDILARLEQAQ